MNNKEVVMYWSRVPGKFVNKLTGEGVDLTINGKHYTGPQFDGSVREWYETLTETLIDVRNTIHRATGKSNREINVSVSPDVLCILESTILYKPNYDKKPRSKVVGTLCGMNVIKSNSVPLREIEVVYKTGSSTERGRVKILDINIIG